MKQTYKPVMLRKLRLSKNFPRDMLHSTKRAFGAGLLSPKTIIDALVLKSYFEHQRVDDWIRKVIQTHGDNVQF